jgi:hypothetical protein
MDKVNGERFSISIRFAEVILTTMDLQQASRSAQGLRDQVSVIVGFTEEPVYTSFSIVMTYASSSCLISMPVACQMFAS